MTYGRLLELEVGLEDFGLQIGDRGFEKQTAELIEQMQEEGVL
ncbi:hypothetical protein D1AOALGA4SA_7470 [Olavius algarvensis Delta 1 endosymbiont]|nr:hypothetical protein D1AOALGA4SA_7470 [Olavius algarvensis Delta 1 endosymbiont]